jgi:hypothetical protein
VRVTKPPIDWQGILAQNWHDAALQFGRRFVRCIWQATHRASWYVGSRDSVLLAQTARDNWAKVAAAIGTLPDGDAIARLLAHLTAEHELLVEAF